jgi:hypothetical protein
VKAPIAKIDIEARHINAHHAIKATPSSAYSMQNGGLRVRGARASQSNSALTGGIIGKVFWKARVSTAFRRSWESGHEPV